MIPYVISEAHPDYKRPSLDQDFGVVKEEEMNSYFLQKICDFILERTDINDLKCEYDIENFFDNYFNEYFMLNSPWEAVVFRNGEWENMTPSNEEIWAHIQLLKLEEEKDQDHEKEGKMEEEINLADYEKETLTKLKDFFTELLHVTLTPETIEDFTNMNQYEQFIFLFNAVTPKKYSENKELFHKFLNISIKIIQKDIEDISAKLENEHNDELSEQLQQLMTVYSNAILVKQTYNIS